MSVAESVLADGLLRRSPLYRYHRQQNAQFLEHSGGALVACYNRDIKVEIDQAQSLAIIDLTVIPRIGFKGADTPEWLLSMGVPLPDKPNAACAGENGGTVARLSQHEFLLLDDMVQSSGQIPALESQWSMDLEQRTYLLRRADSHAWFGLSGAFAPQVLSKLCAVDMRLHKFPQHSVAQTSVARVNSIVVRADQASTPCFYILADLSSCEFMWHGLLDAMSEFNGQAVGLQAMRSLHKI